MVLVWLTDARMSKLIVHHMSTVESGMCPVRSQGHQMRKTENKRLVAMRPSCIKGSNSDYRPMQINQLQSVKFAKVGNRECVKTIARVW